MSSTEERRARARARRRNLPGQVIRCGEEQPALYEGEVLLERLARQTALVERQAVLAGYASKPLPRSQWPVEVFSIDERNASAG